MVKRFRSGLQARSEALLLTLETRFYQLIQGWILLSGLACGLRIELSPVHGSDLSLAFVTPYVLLVLAPVVSALLALRWFADSDSITRTSSHSSWQRTRPVTLAEARQHSKFGTTGIMVSLLIGILLNVPVRAAEYLAANPPISAKVPDWLSMIHIMMSFDVIVFSSLYAITFVAGLRRSPIFPALLMGVWAVDLTMQLVVTTALGRTADLPPEVGRALGELLDGNIKKTLIGVAIWLPYLIMSTRVNVTFRHRLPG